MVVVKVFSSRVVFQKGIPIGGPIGGPIRGAICGLIPERDYKE